MLWKVHLFRWNGSPCHVCLTWGEINSNLLAAADLTSALPGSSRWWSQMPEEKPQSESLSGLTDREFGGATSGPQGGIFHSTPAFSPRVKIILGYFFSFFLCLKWWVFTTDHRGRLQAWTKVGKIKPTGHMARWTILFGPRCVYNIFLKKIN